MIVSHYIDIIVFIFGINGDRQDWIQNLLTTELKIKNSGSICQYNGNHSPEDRSRANS